MPEKIKETISMPVVVPVWSLLTFLAGGLFTAGVMVTKLEQVVEASKKIDTIQERQAANTASITNHAMQLQNHDTRIYALERGGLQK
jgi:hypothetical protein